MENKDFLSYLRCNVTQTPKNHICGTVHDRYCAQRPWFAHPWYTRSVKNSQRVTQHQRTPNPAEYEQPARHVEPYPPRSAVRQSDRNLSPIRVNPSSLGISLTEASSVFTRPDGSKCCSNGRISNVAWTGCPREKPGERRRVRPRHSVADSSAGE